MVDEDLDKLIRTWRHILLHEAVGKGMTEMIRMTITRLEELKKLKEAG